MTPRPHRLRNSALACLVAAWPLLAIPQARSEAEQARLDIGRTAPLEADATLRLWFKKQDKILDDILLRLSHIESLVRELHRLIQQMPLVAAPAPQETPTPPHTPVARVTPDVPAPAPLAVPPATPTLAKPPAPAHTGILAFFDKWGTLLATGGILVLVLMMAARRRGAKTVIIDQPVARVMPNQTAREPASNASPPRQAKGAPYPASAPIAHAPAAAATAEEHNDQALELAEIMLSMGLGHGAAQTLAEQIRSEPKQALRHWLKLLEIYRQNGQQAEFESSAEELRLHFNVHPEDWNMRPEAQRSLEDYPHIAARLTDLWGRPSCLTYLQNLLDDNRGGARSGFPQAVAEELLLLAAILKADGIVPEADAAIDSAQGRR